MRSVCSIFVDHFYLSYMNDNCLYLFIKNTDDTISLVAKLKVTENNERSCIICTLVFIWLGFNTCLVLIVPYTQSLQHKKLPLPVI